MRVHIHLIQSTLPHLHCDGQIEPTVTNVLRQIILHVDRQRHTVHVYRHTSGGAIDNEGYER